MNKFIQHSMRMHLSTLPCEEYITHAHFKFSEWVLDANLFRYITEYGSIYPTINKNVSE
jgi:hypothetical protein